VTCGSARAFRLLSRGSNHGKGRFFTGSHLEKGFFDADQNQEKGMETQPGAQKEEGEVNPKSSVV